jgi:hypothetical protein
MTSASLLVVIIVGTIVGALTGLASGGSVGGLWLAILSGFSATILSAIARNVIIARGAGAGPDTSRTPVLVIVYAVVASLAGSALGMEVANMAGLGTSATLIGALAGLFSVILMAMLLITYHAHPGEQPMLRSGPKI